MPIHGITTGFTLPIVGQLRKGEPKGQNRPGMDLDHFRFVPTDPDDTDLAPHLYRLLGTDEPKKVPFWLPFPTVAECWETWMESYVQGGLVRRCDGETIIMNRDEAGDLKPNLKDGCKKVATGACSCKPVGRLKIIIDELGRDAVVLVPTSSIHDIRAIDGSLKMLEKRATIWDTPLDQLPLILKRVPRMLSMSDGKGGRRRRKYHGLIIEVHPVLAAAIMQKRRSVFMDLAKRMLGEGRYTDVIHNEELSDGERKQLSDGANIDIEVIDDGDYDAGASDSGIHEDSIDKLARVMFDALVDLGWSEQSQARTQFVGLCIKRKTEDALAFSDLTESELQDVANNARMLSALQSAMPGPDFLTQFITRAREDAAMAFKTEPTFMKWELSEFMQTYRDRWDKS